MPEDLAKYAVAGNAEAFEAALGGSGKTPSVGGLVQVGHTTTTPNVRLLRTVLAEQSSGQHEHLQCLDFFALCLNIGQQVIMKQWLWQKHLLTPSQQVMGSCMRV